MSFMDDAKREMEAIREEARQKLDESSNREGTEDNGVVVSDDGTARESTWTESSVTTRDEP